MDKHQKFAAEHGMSSHFVSAKTGDSVCMEFKILVNDYKGHKKSQNYFLTMKPMSFLMCRSPYSKMSDNLRNSIEITICQLSYYFLPHLYSFDIEKKNGIYLIIMLIICVFLFSNILCT